MITPITENITIYRNVDFSHCVDFFEDDEEKNDLTGYSFRFKILDGTGTELLSADGEVDAEKSNRVWFFFSQAELSSIPENNLSWYLLYKNPVNCIGLLYLGKIKTKDGAIWGI